MNHRVFKRTHGTQDCYICSTVDRIDALKDATIPELRAIAADNDLQITVRRAAERWLRKVQRMFKRRNATIAAQLEAK